MSKLKIKHLGDILGITFPDDIEITHATNSTKKVKKNSIFFGLQGTKVHGSKYIEEAIELGASVAVHDDPNFKINNQDLQNKIFYIEDIDKPWTEAEESQKYFIEPDKGELEDEEIGVSYNLYNKLLIFLCELYSDCRFVSSICHKYNIPAFYGFTGTNGKTTSANIACQLENSIWPKGRGIYIGTLGFQYSYYDSENAYENYEMKTKNFDNSISQKTTPDIFEIFEILQKISNDSSCAIPRDEELIINIEVSSHALDQGRLKYIPFRKAVLMNIGSDHIDYHKNIYEYEKSKFKVFDLVHKLGEKYIGIDTINKDGKAFKEYFANQKMPKSISFVDTSADIYCQINQPINSSKENSFKIIENKTVTRYHTARPSYQSVLSGDEQMTWHFVSRHSNEKVFINDKESVFHTDLLQKKHDCYGINMPVDMSVEGDVSYKIETLNPEREYICKIFPEFNIHNLVFGIIASFNPTEITADAFYFEWSARDVAFTEHGDDFDKFIGFRHPIILSERVKLPPGRTQIISNIPANVIIDFAHNAEGFEFFLSSIKEYYQKLVIVFGCGGDRDKEKRPKMLATAIKYGHKIVFTSDNSRSEKFEDIFNDASKGNNIKDVLVIEDRREAIIQGSQLIGNDDCLVILGKGHEQTQEINSNVLHFSDYEVVNEIYN